MKALITYDIYKKFKDAGWELTYPELGNTGLKLLEAFGYCTDGTEEDKYEVHFQNKQDDGMVELIIDKEGILLTNLNGMTDDMYIGLTNDELRVCIELINYWK